MNKNGIALVTGANSGIGKAAATALARQGIRVVMLCRNKQRGEEALSDIKRQSGSGSVELMLCDLGSIESINTFCDEFLKTHDRLDVLINNAGTLKQARRETMDGYELTFGVNYLGAFLLTNRLLPLLKKSAPSRIVNVSSCAHRWGKIHFNDINIAKRYTALKAYSQSKLAGIMFTYALAEDLADTGVAVNAVDPGIVGTDIVVNRETGYGKLAAKAQKLLFKSPEKGAETAVWLAASPDAEGVTGKFFLRKKAVASSKRSYNKKVWERLWLLSERMAGLAAEDAEEYYETVQAAKKTPYDGYLDDIEAAEKTAYEEYTGDDMQEETAAEI
jgi:NAD(P)-dependent dehydrogenase (short-subunit alcohol dehydrogenase family)